MPGSDDDDDDGNDDDYDDDDGDDDFATLRNCLHPGVSEWFDLQKKNKFTRGLKTTIKAA